MHAYRFTIAALARAATLTGTTLALAAATGAFASPRCDEPRNRVDVAACEKAKQSPEALRRYVARTQVLYQLYFYDYMTPEEVDRFYAREQTRPMLIAGDPRD